MDTNYYVDTSYGYNAASADGLVGGMLVIMGIVWIIGLAASILMLVSMWKIFKKVGKPAWAALIPIYNIYVMCQIAEKEWWYIILLCVPFANLYAIFVIYDGIARKFGKSTAFTIGMMFLPMIFFPILAFGKNNSSVYNEIQVQNNEEIMDNNTSDLTTSEEDEVIDSSLEMENSSDVYDVPVFDNSMPQQAQANMGVPNNMGYQEENGVNNTSYGASNFQPNAVPFQSQNGFNNQNQTPNSNSVGVENSNGQEQMMTKMTTENFANPINNVDQTSQTMNFNQNEMSSNSNVNISQMPNQTVNNLEQSNGFIANGQSTENNVNQNNGQM